MIKKGKELENGGGRLSSHTKSVEEEENEEIIRKWMRNLKFNYFL
jgi:hypothetical protein